MATFKGFWHGPPLGLLRHACLNSFIAKGHHFHLYTYQDYAEIPSGVEVKDANEIIPKSNILWYHNQSTGNRFDLGPFSDLFRFKLLSEKGGWWSDTDAICLRSDISDSQESWCQEHSKWYTDCVGTSQLCLRKDGQLALELYNRALEVSKSPLERRESLGPLLLARTIDDLGLKKNYNAIPSQFYPYTWLEMFKLWLPEYKQEVDLKISQSFFLPIYQSMPACAGLDLLRLPPEGSYLHCFLSSFKEKSSPENGNVYDAKEVRDAFRTYFVDNSSWAISQIEDLCGPDILGDFNLKPPIESPADRVKRITRRALNKIQKKLWRKR